MKLQTKFIATLLSVILATFIGAQVFQQIKSRNALNQLSRENIGLLQQREQLQAENIYTAVNSTVLETIAQGDMPKLDSLIARFNQIQGILEYSIYSNQGVAAFSTSRQILKAHKPLPGDLKGQLLSHADKVSRRTDEAFEIYQPVTITAKCLECHDGFKQGGIGGVVLLRLSTETLAKSQQNWTASAAKIQKGNFTVAVGTTLAIILIFVLASWFMVKRLVTAPLSKIINHLQHAAQLLTHSSTEVSASSQILAEGASEQAASLEETGASLEEMSSMTRRNAENARASKNLATRTRLTAQSGMQSTRQMIEAMEAIKGTSQEMRSAMEGIKSASGDISKIIKTIDEIAFQTNILALNAAVEAARAGEAGLGFAVVADEVRNLAQRSAAAAKETATMIETAIHRSEVGVQVNDRVHSAVEQVSQRSKEVEQRLNEIAGEVQQLDEAAAEVATASAEQSTGIAQVNTAIGQMDKVTQSNAASAEESAAAAQELSAQATLLKKAVNELQELIGGNSTTTTPRPSPAGNHGTAPAAKPFLTTAGNGTGSREIPLPTAPTHEITAANLPAGRGFKDF